MTTRDLPASTTVCIAGCGPAGAQFSRFMAIGIRNEHVTFQAHAVPTAAGRPL